MRTKQKKYRMDEPTAWDSPWTLVLLLALLCLGMGLWLSVRGSGWTPDSPSALAERFLGDPAARKALEQMRDDHQERLAAMKTDHQAKVDKLKGQIQAARRENARLLGEIEKRSATP